MNEAFAHLATALTGRYTLERELGRGGMATVYLAQDLKHQRPVALKVLHAELVAALGSERFLREITLTAGLQHPHILPLLDSGEAAGQLFYVMPYVEGESLRNRLDREHQLPLEDALAITREVADALGHAHSRGIIHRDIKPENLLLASGHALVADFGIAKAVSAGAGEKLTQTGLAVGTPAYMSPEQAAGSGQVDGRSDLYALGCVLYEMLSGEPPYVGTTPQGIFAKKLAEPAPRVSVMRETVPPGVEAALLKVLARSPADRFPTAERFAAALAQAAMESATRWAGRDVGPSRGWRRWLRRPAAAVTLLAVAFVAAGLVVLWRSRAAGAGKAAAPPAKRIALLPCVNAARDSSQDWLVDRWTDELTTKLGQVSTLVVRPFASVQAAQQRGPSLQDIARTLVVDYMVSCRLALRGDSVDLRLSVSSVEPEAVVWSGGGRQLLAGAEYSDFQAVLAHQLAAELGADVTFASRAQLAAHATRDSIALRLYRQAVGPARTWRTQVSLLQEAIRRDPDFILPYTALASQLVVGGVARDSLSPREAYRAADALLTEAAALDSLDPDVLGLRAFNVLVWEHDWPRARTLFERAISVSPNSGQLRGLYAEALGDVGLLDEAITQERSAVDQLPAGEPCYLAHLYFKAGRFAEADSLMRRRLAAAPDELCAMFVLGYTRTLEGRHAEAIELLRRVHQVWDETLSLATLGYAYGRAGRTADAERAMAELRRRGSARYAEPVFLALVAVGLGRRQEALDLLEQALPQSGEWVVYALGPTPWFDPLRDDPRFQEMRRRVGVYVGGR